MTADIAICLAILAFALALFAWDRVPADAVAIGVMLALVLTGLLSAQKAFAGFGSDTVMMILGLLIMTAGLVHTGVVDAAGRLIFEYAGRKPATFLPVIILAVAVVSAFMSNTAATAFFIPLVLGYAEKTGTSASNYLLPVAFASILTSSVTLISTSTNIVVSELITHYRMPPMGMFELAPVGIPIAIAGLLYIWLIGARLIPYRTNQQPPANIGQRTYQADVVVMPEGPLVNKTLDQAGFGEESGLTVVKIIREGKTLRAGELQDLTLQADDALILEGLRANLLKIKEGKGLAFKADVKLADPGTQPEEVTIVEGVLLPNSPLIGETLQSLGFKERYGLQVLALHRAGRVPRTISAARLRMGDVLLLQGRPENVKGLERGNLFNIFGGVEAARLHTHRAPLAAAIFVLAVGAATLKLVSFPVAVLAGAFLMFLTRCISPDEAYRDVEWKALVLIGALLSLGTAMETTGAGRYVAAQLLAVTGTGNIYLLLSCFFVLSVALTQPMSNQAAAVVVLPIAVETALQANLDPRGFAMMVAIAASCSYLTPLEPSCLMVYGPGKYKFSDFFKVGLPLTFIIYLIAVLMVPLVWPP